MKAKDLMVGDLVLHDGKVIRVDAVHKRKIGYHKTNDKLTWLFSGQFEPIQLTHEIFEKNGFRKTDAGVLIGIDDKVIMDKYADHLDGTIWEVVIYSTKKHVSTISELTYLHELQNLLNICKISKEIVV